MFPNYSHLPATRNPYVLGGLGLVLAGVLVEWSSNKPVAAPNVPVEPVGSGGAVGLSITDLNDGQERAFKQALPPIAKPFASFFVAVGREIGVSPYILAGIMSRESGFGAACPNLPKCRGSGGNDYGLMQINTIHKAFFASKVNGRPAYEDPEASIRYGAKVYREYFDYLRGKSNLTGTDLYAATAAAYNAGPGNVMKALRRGRSYDSVTTGKDYGRDVLRRAGRFMDVANAAVG